MERNKTFDVLEVWKFCWLFSSCVVARVVVGVVPTTEPFVGLVYLLILTRGSTTTQYQQKT